MAEGLDLDRFVERRRTLNEKVLDAVHLGVKWSSGVHLETAHC